MHNKDVQDKLYASGLNNHGQLGVGDTTDRRKWTEVPFPEDLTIEKVVVVDNQSFVKGKGKDGEDKLYACGYNEGRQLGLEDFTKRTEWTEVPIRNRVLKSIVSQEEASMNKKRSRGK